MKKNIPPLFAETYYHIYNRGINGENIFKEHKNYQYFLSRFNHFISPIAHTYAYCLLPNHFHILIKTKNEREIKDITNKALLKRNFPLNKNEQFEGSLPMPNVIKLSETSYIISRKFSDFFKSYTLSINKAYSRTGGLFEEPFRRIEVSNDAYFTKLVYYIHANPQKHGIIGDFKEYPYSSYHSFMSKKPTKLMRDYVIDWFGNEQNYIGFHNMFQPEKGVEQFIVEFD